MSGNPTARSLAYLRSQGFTCWVTEYWHAFARRRVDLFGIVDILALRPGEVLGVQTTSAANVSSRVRKIAASEYAPKLREFGIVTMRGPGPKTRMVGECAASAQRSAATVDDGNRA
jgi:hypothetical protein